MEDLPLIKEEFIRRRDLFTIRKGELIRDNVNENLLVSQVELIKMRERKGGVGGCIFYDDTRKACTIYEHRPVQCSTFKCWDTEDFDRVYGGPKLTRREVVQGEVLLGMLEEHERRCSYSVLEKCVKQIESEGEKAVEKILDLLRFDFHLRPFISEKLGLSAEETDFLFGRPLSDTITMFGLKVVREQDGSFLLTTANNPHRRGAKSAECF
jgi:Fe-S-cluster containining protein